MTFDLDYLVDNGRLYGWESDIEPGCAMMRYTDPDGFISYSVHNASGKPIGYGDDKADAIWSARYLLTDRRRAADGIVPAKVC